MSDSSQPSPNPDGTDPDDRRQSQRGQSDARAEEIVDRYWRSVWIERDLSVLGELYTDPTIRHTVAGTRTVSVAQLQHDLGEGLRALRGESFTVDQLTVVNDTAWLRLTLRAVSVASMSPMAFTWLAQYRLVEGRIAETWALHEAGLSWT